MENKYQIIALIGKSGAGKDTVLSTTCECHPLMFHRIVSCTTRPKRENEEDGKNYHFISIEDFTRKVLNGEMIEATEFRDWFYGTCLNDLVPDKINIGIFNPASLDALLADSSLDVTIVEIVAPDVLRLARNLSREEHPDCEEICRRFLADEKDFASLEYDCLHFDNDNYNTTLDLCSPEEKSLFDTLKMKWEALEVNTSFETVTRWENSMPLRAESEIDKGKTD